MAHKQEKLYLEEEIKQNNITISELRDVVSQKNNKLVTRAIVIEALAP